MTLALWILLGLLVAIAVGAGILGQVLKDSAHRWWTYVVGVALVLTVVWVAGVFAWVQSDSSSQRFLQIGPTAGPRACEDVNLGFTKEQGSTTQGSGAQSSPTSTGDASSNKSGGDSAANVLTLQGDSPVLKMGSARGATGTQLTMKPSSPPAAPDEIKVQATALSRESGGVLGTPRVKASVLANRVLLDICVVVDPKITWSRYSGTYKSEILISDTRYAADPIVLEVQVQARYLWLLAPWVIWSGLAAVALLGKSDDTKRAKAVSIATAAAAAGVVFASQGAENASWGGGVVPIFALVAAMYVAATGTVATVKAASRVTSSKEAVQDGTKTTTTPSNSDIDTHANGES